MLSKSLVVTKQVKSFPEDAKYRKKDFLSECQKEHNFPIQNQEINIQASDNFPSIHPENIINPGMFSFGALSTDDITYIANQLIKITFDPLQVAKLLKNLDEELGRLMQENKISFPEKDSLPSYLLAGRGHFIPGAPSASYCPKKKAELLDRLLVERENINKINLSGYAVKFIGYISSMIADQLISSGQLFSENKQVNRVLLHGSYSHRLMFAAFAEAIKTGDLDLKTQSGKNLDFIQLLEILVSVKVDGLSLWEKVLDTVEDSKNASSNPLNSKQFDFSCRSPFVFNSLLLCFGKELDLPNLQLYLLDSHYKAVSEMILRTKEKIASQLGITNYFELHIPNERIYELCMEYASTMAASLGEVGGKTPFTLDETALLSDPRYQETIWGGIVKKARASKETGQYSSMVDYFESKGLLENGFFTNKEAEKRKILAKYGIKEGRGALEQALFCSATAGNASDIEWLLKQGVNPNSCSEKNGYTALHQAIKSAYKDEDLLTKYQKCVQILLEHGADLKIRDYEYSTPIQYDKKKLFETVLKTPKKRLQLDNDNAAADVAEKNNENDNSVSKTVTKKLKSSL